MCVFETVTQHQQSDVVERGPKAAVFTFAKQHGRQVYKCMFATISPRPLQMTTKYSLLVLLATNISSSSTTKEVALARMLPWIMEEGEPDASSASTSTELFSQLIIDVVMRALLEEEDVVDEVEEEEEEEEEAPPMMPLLLFEADAELSDANATPGTGSIHSSMTTEGSWPFLRETVPLPGCLRIHFLLTSIFAAGNGSFLSFCFCSIIHLRKSMQASSLSFLYSFIVCVFSRKTARITDATASGIWIPLFARFFFTSR